MIAHELDVRSSSRDFLQHDITHIAGALKATGNRGLQPAMDHIIEHEGQPIPDLSGVNEQSSSSGPMDMDNDDDDAAALKSLGVVSGNEVEAKVGVKQK